MEPRRGTSDERGDGEPRSVVRHEEEASATAGGWQTVGSVHARKRVETRRVREEVPVDVEDVELERRPVSEGDSGEIETLPDGSVSIPVFEEELVVTRRTVLKERVVIRKAIVTERAVVEDTVRVERVDVDVDDSVARFVEVEPGRDETGSARRDAAASEAKPSLWTSELWVGLLAVAAIVVAAWVSDALDSVYAWVLIAALAAAYAVARGLAKARARAPRP